MNPVVHTGAELGPGAINLEANGLFPEQLVDLDGGFGVSTAPSSMSTALDTLGRWAEGACLAVDVVGNLVYFSSGPSLEVADISVLHSPVRLGKILLGRHIEDISVEGQYAYVACFDKGLAIVDVSVPSSLQLVGTFDAGYYTYGVHVEGNLVYLTAGGLKIIDASDPTAPVLLGSLSCPSTALAVTVDGDHAYVTTSHDGLRVIDISDSTSPYEVDSGTVWEWWYGHDICHWGQYVYIAESSGMHIFDISDPLNIVRRGSYDTSTSAMGVAVEYPYVFVGNYSQGLRVVNVSDPLHPTTQGGYYTPGWAHKVAVASGVAYIADCNNGVFILDTSNPIPPFPTGGLQTGGSIRRVKCQGDYAYAAISKGGLWVIDVTDPSQPQGVGFTLGSGYNWYDLELNGNYAYVPQLSLGKVSILDISSPSAPLEIGTYNTGGWTCRLDLHDGHLFVADGEFGVMILGLSNPASPSYVRRVMLTGVSMDVACDGDFAYVGGANGVGLTILDISNINLPVQLGSISSLHIEALDVSNGIAVVSSGNDGVTILDVSAPSAPVELSTYNTSGLPKYIEKHGHIVYVADTSGGVLYLDISDPYNPNRIAHFSTGGSASGVTLGNGVAVVGDYYEGLWITEDRLFGLVSPADGGLVNDLDIPFEWDDSGADFYELWVDDDSDFSSPEIMPFHFEPFDCDSLEVTQFPWGGGWLPVGQYFWKVRANSAGVYTETDVWMFYYVPPLADDPTWSPLYRLYNAQDKDHFYCTSEGHQQIAQNQGYREERVEGFVSSGRFWDSDMAHLFRFYDDARDCHYYTSVTARVDSLIGEGLRYEGITGYGYKTQQPGLVPLHHLSAPGLIDNLYTTSEVERQHVEDVLGFTYEDITCFVSPTGDTPNIAAHLFAAMVGNGISAGTGNFQHYSMSSFAIPSIGLPLSFDHVYNSFSVHLLSQVMPLGPGWSHTYNTYVLTIPDQWLVVWPDGSLHRYSQSTGKCLDREYGVYDEIEILPGGKFEITKKNQVVYTFERPAGVSSDYPSMLTSIADRNQNTIACGYESSGLRRLTSVSGTAGRQLTFTYHTDTLMTHLIAQIEDVAGGRSVHFAYEDSNRNLTLFTDCDGKTTQYIYDYEDPQLGQDHQLTRIILPEGNVIDNSYQDRKITGQSWTGSQLTLTYQDNQSTVDDGEGHQTQYTFDALTRVEDILDLTGGTGSTHLTRADTTNPALPTSVVDRNGNTTQYTYDNRGNALTIARPLGVQHTFQYDTMNNVTSYVDPNSHETSFVYDPSGNLTSANDPLLHTTILQPRPDGLVERITNPLGHPTHFEYDSHGNMTEVRDNLGNSTHFEYDQIGRITQKTDPEGFITTYQHDCSDRLTNRSTEGEVTSYTYDDNGNLTRVEDAESNPTVWAYNDLDLVESVTNAVGDLTGYTYNQDGTLASRTRPNGTVTYSYDGSGRLAGISSSGATLGRDGNGNISSLSDAQGTMSYNYNALDRLDDYTDYDGHLVDYGYDLAGNLVSLTYEPGKSVTYNYYNDNRLHTVTDWNGRTTTYTYLDDGSLETITYPNGAAVTFSYDLADRLTGLIHRKSDASVIAEYSYELDERGYPESETRTEPLTTPVLPLENAISIYDAANRLQSAGPVTYDYDGAGNMISRTGPDGIACTYDLENRLTTISGSASASYVYDTFGNRRAGTREGTTTGYVLDVRGMSQVLIEKDATGTPQNYYIHGLGLISRIKPDGTTHYYHFNNIGSIVAMTDQGENVTHSYLYSPFGRLIDSIEPDENPFRFVGYHGVMAEVAGLSYMRARYYERSTGRFLSEDPIWGSNLYSYAMNNPISRIDPGGMLSMSFRMTGTNWLLPHLENIAEGCDNLKNAFSSVGRDATASLRRDHREGGYIGATSNLVRLQFLTDFFVGEIQGGISQISSATTAEKWNSGLDVANDLYLILSPSLLGKAMGALNKGGHLSTDLFNTAHDLNTMGRATRFERLMWDYDRFLKSFYDD